MDDLEYTEAVLERAVEKWRGQNRKGYLEMCLLRCIEAEKRTYGFALMERMQQLGMDISEGSLYPLLTRMVKEGTLRADWETPSEGHPRKYYTLTLFGIEYLQRIAAHYQTDYQVYQMIHSEGADR